MEKRVYEELYLLEKDYWWHVAKRQLVFREISRLKISKNARVLDVGCGTGIVMKELENKFPDIHGVDNSPLALKYCRQRNLKKTKNADLTERLSYKDNSFSLVTCLDVIEHIDDDRKALKEINRILLPGGLVLLTVPAFQFLWTAHDEILWHKRRYRRRELLKLVQDCGFKVRKASYFYSFLFLPAIILFKIMKVLFNNKSGKTSILPPKIINNLLIAISTFEHWIISFYCLPFGLSLLVIAEKNK